MTPAPILFLPQTSHNHLQVVSTAEVLFNDSQFALLPGQEAFVRAQVSVSDPEGPLEAGEEACGRERGGGG